MTRTRLRDLAADWRFGALLFVWALWLPVFACLGE